MVGHAISNRLATTLTCILAASCTTDAPGPAEVRDHRHAAFAASLSPSEVAQALSTLRAHTAAWHNPEKAAEAGYTFPVGCSDERTEGLSAALARGMGYHTLNPDLLDGSTSLLEPELIVFGRNPSSGKLRYAGFDYFIPGDFYPGPSAADYPGTPPILEGLGTPLLWNDAHNGWIAHIWPWWHNPDGMFENFNPTIPLCECEVRPDLPICTL
jgi:hypothetical protein